MSFNYEMDDDDEMPVPYLRCSKCHSFVPYHQSKGKGAFLSQFHDETPYAGYYQSEFKQLAKQGGDQVFNQTLPTGEGEGVEPEAKQSNNPPIEEVVKKTFKTGLILPQKGRGRSIKIL